MQHVAATNHSMSTGRATSPCKIRCGGTSQRQISSLVLKNFCENFVSRDRILSSRRQTAKNQISLNLCPNVATTKFCHRDNCFLQKFSSENDAIHRCDVFQPTVSRAWVCFSFDLNVAFQTKISFCYFVVLAGVLFRRLINRSIFY